MTFNYIAAKKVFDCKSLIEEKLPIALDIGVQTPSISRDVIEKYIKIRDLSSKQEYFYKKILQNENFTTKDFFLALGYDDYFSIDINGADNSFQFDLNYDLSEKYNFNKKFDLVINNGTGEHVFNQFSLFKNIHQITKNNGIMLHILPFIDWINHGFYNFNPILFADLAASNHYEILDIILANRNGGEVFKKNKKKLNQFYEQVKPNYESRLKEFIKLAKKNLNENILLVVILRKTIDNNFRIPLQGKYLADLSDNNEYSNQSSGSSNAFGQEMDSIKR